ncbi:MAG: T9SS type A sorting domain-containing protein [Candidatus Krumholzibacteriia bacterium]
MPRIALSCALSMLLLVAISPAAADDRPRSGTPYQNEVPDDPYVRSPRTEHPRSPAKNFTRDSFFAVQVNVDDLGQNIVGDAANEPSIAVDPTDPDRMVIGWRQFDTVASNFRQAGYAYTVDGGQTWTFPGVIEPGIFRSDPVLDSDSQGGIYYNSLTVEGSSDYLCDVFRSTAAGQLWDAGTSAQGGDKQWMVIDKTGGVGDGHIYAYWTSFFSSCSPGFFTRSVDDGDSYEPCIEIPDDPYWGTLAVAPGSGFNPSGVLYVVGAYNDDFVVARSVNARYAGQATAWDQTTVVQLGGYIDSRTGPNPDGLLGQASIATAPSAVPLGHEVYVLCSVNPPGSDPLDVTFARSTDGGATWSEPVRVNDDTGNNWQWFGTMATSPSGRIDAIWLDTRDNPGTVLSSLYYSYSEDGGVTWSANERLSDAFDPHVGWPNQNKMGDYFHMVSDDAGFSLAWAATFNGEQDVYFGRKTLGTTTAVQTRVASLAFLAADPNPFTASTTIRYDIPGEALVTLTVYDMAGRRVATLVSSRQPAGSHEVQLDGRSLASGVYLCRLSAGASHGAEKLLIVK